MATQSKVLIQGGDTPGGRLEVIVPVEHTFATDFARATYEFPNAQYIWVTSWDPEENARRAQRISQNSTMSFGEKVVGAGFLFLLVIIAGLFADDSEDTTPMPEAPESSYEAPAPAAPSAPVYVPSPSPVAAPRYASEPSVAPVWENDEDLTGNPDFTFND